MILITAVSHIVSSLKRINQLNILTGNILMLSPSFIQRF